MVSGNAVIKRIGTCAVALLVSAAWLLPAVAQNDPGRVTDVIVGRNNKGPYALSYTNVDPDSVRVIINGMTLKRGEKYDIDFARGIISFTSTVLNDAIVRVSYTIIPNKSKPNTNKVNVPVTLNVFQRQDASVQVTGLYAQDDPKNPDAGKTVIGLGGEKKWESGKLTSQVFMSQRNEQDKNGGQPDAWERSAFRIGSETTFGKVKFTGSLLRAGKEFAGGSETGLGRGKRASDLGVVVAPTANVRASANLRQTEEAAGDRTTAHDQSLTAALTRDTTVAITHSATETTTAASDSGKVVDSTGVKVDQRIGGAGASVAATTSTITTAATTDRINTQEATISSKIATARVGLEHKDSDTSGQSNRTDVAVQVNPFQNAEFKGRVVTAQEMDQTRFQRDASLIFKPVRFAKVEASLSQNGVNENDDVTKAARVELSPFSHTQVSAGMKYVETGPEEMTITDYAAITRPAGFISLAASLRRRDLKAADAPDSSAVQMSLAPLKFVTLTGGYQSNPEDDKGRMQQYNATNVGLKVRFGSVGIVTDYKAKNEYAAHRISDEGKIGLEMAAFGGGTLTTGLAISRMLDGSASSTNTYSLGYKHAVGSAFEFALTGYYKEYLRNRAVMPDKTEYSAEASLGVRF